MGKSTFDVKINEKNLMILRQIMIKKNRVKDILYKCTLGFI